MPFKRKPSHRRCYMAVLSNHVRHTKKKKGKGKENYSSHSNERGPIARGVAQADIQTTPELMRTIKE